MADIDKLVARRRIGLMVSASAFLIWQVPIMDFSERLIDEADIVMTGVSLAGFLVWIVTLLLLVGPWRPWQREAALNDELTQSNRKWAFLTGYVAVMLATAGMLALSLYQPVSGIEASHLILVIGVVAPLYCFAILERG